MSPVRVREGPRGNGEVALEADLDLHARPGVDPHTGEMLGGEIELHVAVAIDVEDGRPDPRLADGRLGTLEPLQARRVERGAELRELDAARQVRAAGEKMSRPWKVWETRSSM